MTEIIMVGCNGRMGQVISNLVAQDENAKIVAGVDVFDDGRNPYPVFKNLEECTVAADAVIDFSSPKSLEVLLRVSKKRNLPLVLCTTGYTEEDLKKIEEASKEVAILRSANMSLGVNTLLKLVSVAANVLAKADFDIEIIEKHHNQKVDAPSGTALALADAINEALNNEYHYMYDRSKVREKRDIKEIGISAVRGGNIVGEHEVIFAGTDEVIEFKHTAYSKAIFAKGAITAAKYLAGKGPGLYSMSDVIA
ncbi:4-hydroxy-tetrahydrodipicolinate reductase [Lachnoclostridium phytofermentans]|uniref:4-hydroxy-tetrahydrodipicolinate reductase n=1 Tax=Lachnoclostridium phytofermentans (strain ATCC 700394 / DSM 18823 / ISDg) TaxID=357809 RepID=A9KHY5_LACP7|nr:4-hydroxy-tetrahydrodipicolinate reductase [Lachnoclostridium phytofermentans]ABX43832.1 Dihydrodipicolinate reductase [Lachnoclostridium phytofermentans ISDg]